MKRKFLNPALVMICTPLLLTCSSGGGGSGGGGVGSLLCGLFASSHDSKSLTVGLDAGFLNHLKLNLLSDDNLVKPEQQTEALNNSIKDSLNTAFSTLGISEQINVSAVEDVPDGDDQDDGVRFLSLGGSLASGVGLASTLIKNALSNANLKDNFPQLMADPSTPSFDFIEDSFRVKATVMPEISGDFNNQQWAFHQTSLEKAVTTLDGVSKNGLTETKTTVKVAVIDTGVAYDHPALKDRFVKDESGNIVGKNFVDTSKDADDDQGHGTHCAGIIAADKVDDGGMSGVVNHFDKEKKVQILPVKVLGENGGGSTASINKGVRWAMDQGADVISMSLGGAVPFAELLKATGAENSIFRQAVDRGIIVVVAAGNENCPLGGDCEQTKLFVLTENITDYTVVPCSYNGVICVGATDPDLTLASYSNYPSADGNAGVPPTTTDKGTKRTTLDIAAPGTDIYSTYLNQDYKALSGTSMATPYVAGLAAMFKLYVSVENQNLGGKKPQTHFWELIRGSSVGIAEEASATRSSAQQVDLYYFAENLKLLANASGAADTSVDYSQTVAPTVKAVGNPVEGGGADAPNLLSLICGG